MKAVRKILFAHGDDNSLGPIFKSIVQREISGDPVLATAGLIIDSVGIEGGDGEAPGPSVRSALSAVGIKEIAHTSKNLWLHQDLVSWADLILAPSLKEEDLLCLKFTEAWSKALPVECYCGQYKAETGFRPGYAPRSEDECRAAADVFLRLLPHIIDRIKDSYCDALLARGVPICEGRVIGEVFTVKQASDLEEFWEGSILVADRPGAILYKGLDESMAVRIIEKFTESPVFTDNVADIVGEIETLIKGETAKQSNLWLKNGASALFNST